MKIIAIVFLMFGFLPFGARCFDLHMEIQVLVGLDKSGNADIEILHRSRDNLSGIDRNPIDDQNTYLICKIVSEWEVEGVAKYHKFVNLLLADKNGQFIFKNGEQNQKLNAKQIRQMSSREIFSFYRIYYPEDLPYREK